MQSLERHLKAIPNDDECDLAEPKSPEEFVDRFGMRAALLILCVGLLIAAVWMVTTAPLSSITCARVASVVLA
jgi:hypothetical protein